MKNLRVDVILPDERRSTSPVSLKLIGRIVLLTVVMALVISGALFFINVRTTRSRLEDMNDQHSKMDIKVKQAEKLEKERIKFEAMVNEMEKRNRSRNLWDQALKDWWDVIPENIQLADITVNDPLKKGRGGKTVWGLRVVFTGRAGGEDPSGEVDKLVEGLNSLTQYGIRAFVKGGSFRRDQKSETGEFLFVVIAEHKPKVFK